MIGAAPCLLAAALAWSVAEARPARNEPDGASATGPSIHSLIYYNARMALREGKSLEAIKLWLLRNAVEQRTGTVSPFDADFHSVTWAALGDAGICQDGYPTDDDGAGLWPLALHNWVVRTLSHRSVPKRANLFEAFQVGRQQRFVSIDDALSAEELATVHLERSRCARARLFLVGAGETVTSYKNDRQVAAHLLKMLLERARSTLVRSRVRGAAAIEARLFDVHLALTAMAAQQARREARDAARTGRAIGMSSEAVASMNRDAPAYTFDPRSAEGRILRACTGWSPAEWMALSPDRRVFLFDRARAFAVDHAPPPAPEPEPEPAAEAEAEPSEPSEPSEPAPQPAAPAEPDPRSALDRIALGIVDRSIARGEGSEVERWIGRIGPDPSQIWSGERGQRLLALDRGSGFRERGVIALRRGVDALEHGDLPNALRSFAFALQAAPDSRASEAVQSLSRRWLSYAAGQFAITDDLLVTLRELAPRRDYGIVLEDLMWRAAFHADNASFRHGLDNQVRGDALERRLTLLQPLAAGDVDRFEAQVRTALAASPSETVRFLGQLVERLELEDADVRAAQIPALTRVRRLLAPLAPSATNTGSQGRAVEALLDRSGALLEGVGGLGPDADARDRARALSATGELYAGSVRLAPADPLPWPFAVVEVDPPSVFAPITLTPEEWRADGDGWVFGWSIGG